LARIAVSAVSAFLLAACFGGVIVHHAVGASLGLLLSKSATATTLMTTITSALQIMGGTSRRVSEFGDKGSSRPVEWHP
jgi:hypothetical protein